MGAAQVNGAPVTTFRMCTGPKHQIAVTGAPITAASGLSARCATAAIDIWRGYTGPEGNAGSLRLKRNGTDGRARHRVRTCGARSCWAAVEVPWSSYVFTLTPNMYVFTLTPNMLIKQRNKAA